jgi:hypothetical protein
MVPSAKTRSAAAATSATTVMLGSGTFDDGDPLLQATAAQPLPKGAGAVTMAAPASVGGGWDNMEPGTRQLTTTATTVTRSQRHFGATIQG